jgi:hypothetical protein
MNPAISPKIIQAKIDILCLRWPTIIEPSKDKFGIRKHEMQSLIGQIEKSFSQPVSE